MKELTKKIVTVIGIIGAVASIISLIIVLKPNGIGNIRVASIEIQGLQDFYVSNSQEDLSFNVILFNNGNEYITVENVFIEQLMPSGNYLPYLNVNINPARPQISVGSSVNMSVSIPAHKALGNTEFKIFIYYNDGKNTESRLFYVTWF